MNPRVLTIMSIILGVLLLIALGFLILFGFRLADASKVKSAEVASNLVKQETKLKADFQKEREITTTSYTAAEMFGSFSFSYPKVWSTNVTQAKGAREELVFLADPSLIIDDKDASGPYAALRVQVLNTSYDSTVKDMHSRYVTRSKDAYEEADTTLSGIKGKKYTGLDTDSKKNIAITIIPLRDKTLFVGTDDSDKYSANLATILKSFKVSK